MNSNNFHSENKLVMLGTTPDNAAKITYDGRTVENAVKFGPDSVLVHRFVQDVMGRDVDALYAQLDMDCLWTNPADADFRYRGKELLRQKAYNVAGEPFEGFLDGPPALIAKYGFPGFSYGAMDAYRIFAANPSMEELVEEFTRKVTYNGNPIAINHAIATKYRDGRDNIGWHADKTRDIRDGSPIPILSLGASREFQLGKPDPRNRKLTNLVHAFEFRAGDLFVLGPQTNAEWRHAVVPVAHETLQIERREREGGDVLPRISVVFRDIKTVVPRVFARERAATTEKKRRKKLMDKEQQ